MSLTRLHRQIAILAEFIFLNKLSRYNPEQGLLEEDTQSPLTLTVLIMDNYLVSAVFSHFYRFSVGRLKLYCLLLKTRREKDKGKNPFISP